MPASIRSATSPEDIARCYPVLAELRPQLASDEFVATVRRLATHHGFQIAYLFDDGVKAVAGYRIAEWLHAGKYLEIEDFVTTSAGRSKGYGARLFEWLVAEAAREGCRQLRLVSGVKRIDAHRFYLRQGMVHEGNYFSMDIPAGPGENGMA